MGFDREYERLAESKVMTLLWKINFWGHTLQILDQTTTISAPKIQIILLKQTKS